MRFLPALLSHLLRENWNSKSWSHT